MLNKFAKFIICSLGIFIGERSFLYAAPEIDIDSRLNEAKSLFAHHHYGKAKQATSEVLQKQNREDAQMLMAAIIDREIEEERESLGNEPVSKDIEIQKWLERSKSFLALHQFDEALLAAEKVFSFDAYNIKASRLIDDIRQRALEDGKQGVDALSVASEEEVAQKIKNYRNQANEWITKHRWGAAKMVIDKILLLNPYDREALIIREQIQAHTNEKRKTL